MTKKKIIKILLLSAGFLLALNLILLGYFLFFNKSLETTIKPSQINFKVIFLDVGQGDAILLQDQVGINVLIDGGPDSNIIYKLDQYISITNRKIDLMILTHPDPDHLNGLVEVLKRYTVKKVFYNGVNDPDFTYTEWKRLIETKKISSHIIERPQVIQLNPFISLNFLWPRQSLVGQDLKDDNRGSLVIKAFINQSRFLLTGDADKEMEQELMQTNQDLSADVLKVGHHGSKSSSSLEFLEKVQPKYAVISVGRNNRFGHPNFRVLKNLGTIKAQVLRTDEKGDIIFISKGNELNVKTTK